VKLGEEVGVEVSTAFLEGNFVGLLVGFLEGSCVGDLEGLDNVGDLVGCDFVGDLVGCDFVGDLVGPVVMVLSQTGKYNERQLPSFQRCSELI
jgi:hypothetical protein